MKLAKWSKGIVEWREGDTVNLSVVFSWDCAEAKARAEWALALGQRVRVGGPGVFIPVSKAYFRDFEERGVELVTSWNGLDVGEVVVRHNPHATFASRGCPVGCSFCIVPPLEGRDFTLIDNFVPRPILCDNNLSALPHDFQRHIVKRYQDSGVPLLDANSGFEPRTFDEETYATWNPVNRGPWRFALDDEGDMEPAKRVLDLLRDRVPNNRMKRVYVLIGRDPFEQCMERIKTVIDRGGEPHVQPFIKLHYQEKKPWVGHDWTPGLLRDVTRWANRRLWKYTDFKGYSYGTKGHPEPMPLFEATG